MFARKSFLKYPVGILLCSLLFSMFCFSSSAASTSDVNSTDSTSKTAIAANASLYHKYFDLDNTQKDELAQRGYTDTQISKVDTEDFNKLESKWNLSSADINNAKTIYPDLKNTDMSSWTYSDFDAYSTKQDDITYSPTSEQATQLQKRGISLKLAREMLKDYCTYDNLLLQSDSELTSMQALYTEADKEGSSSVEDKEAVRNQYDKNVSIE
jgi:hypothetical protein